MRVYTILALVILSACAAPEPVAPPQDTLPTPAPPARRASGVPDGWSGFVSEAYDIGRDLDNMRGGAAAAYIASRQASGSSFGVINQFVRADKYRGKRVRLRGWLRVENADAASLYMRVDGARELLGFDNMEGRALTGSGDWQEVSVVLDVPDEAVGIAFGPLLQGEGDLLVDDMTFEVVGVDVPETDLLSEPEARAGGGGYRENPVTPLNLDFEGVPPIAEAAIQWLTVNSYPIATTEPGSDLSDLEPLRDVLGTARVVGLGEGTHGTREFFLLKHRILEFLVREMGFRTFAMEASWPEANDINQYVLTGEGDPAQLLRNLLFWTWNTQEVLDLILWMRAWNQSAAPGDEVRFAGFDMQFPFAAIDTVKAFIVRVDPGQLEYVSLRHACLEPLRPSGNYFPPRSAYLTFPADVRAACRIAVQEVFDLIDRRRADYQLSATEEEYDRAWQSARLVTQYEAVAGATTNSSALRDLAMADNVEWLLSRTGLTGKVVLWAHNMHVINESSWLGGHLRSRLGEDYRAVGFLFGRGKFNAFGPDGIVAERTATVTPANSFEHAFGRTGHSLALLDLVMLAQAGEVVDRLRGGLLMRSVGSYFDQSQQSEYFRYFSGDQYNALIYVDMSTPTQRR